MIEMRTKHHVGIFQHRIRAFDQSDHVVTDLFIEHDERIVDVDGDLRGQCDWSNRLAATRRSENVGELNRAAVEQRFEERFITCELRRHDAIHALNGRDICRCGRLCPATRRQL